MRFKPYQFWILGLTVAFVFLASMAYAGRTVEPQQEAVAFVTVGLDQSQLPAENSSYEIQRAVEHFSDVILGWTVEPSFANDFEKLTGGSFGYSGRRQEKENLLFTVTGPVQDTVPAQELVDLIDARLAEYNAASHSGYVLALVRTTVVETHPSSWRSSLGLAFLAGCLEAVLFLALSHAPRR